MPIVAKIYPQGQLKHGVSTTKRRDAKHPLVGITLRTDENGHRHIYLQSRDIPNGEIQNEMTLPGATFCNRWGERYVLLSQYNSFSEVIWSCVDSEVYFTTLSGYICSYVARGELTYIGSSIPPILEKTSKSRKKCTSISSRMKLRISNAAYLLQEKYGKHLLSFLTLTIPSVSDEELDAILGNWGKITNLFLKNLGNHITRLNGVFEYVYCTEIQLKRLAATGQYCPHLHIVFRGRHRPKCPWYVTPKLCRKMWIRSLRHYATISKTVSACENLQVVRKDVSRYLSKYLSKGNNSDILSNYKAQAERLQTQWGGMSRQLSRYLDRRIIRMVSGGNLGQYADAIVRYHHVLTERKIFVYYYAWIIQLQRNDDSAEGRGIKCGSGMLSKAPSSGGIAALFAALDELISKECRDE